jgi:hypothetical protein
MPQRLTLFGASCLGGPAYHNLIAMRVFDYLIVFQASESQQSHLDGI